jgi:hypothetical protein
VALSAAAAAEQLAAGAVWQAADVADPAAVNSAVDEAARQLRSRHRRGGGRVRRPLRHRDAVRRGGVSLGSREVGVNLRGTFLTSKPRRRTCLGPVAAS